MQTKKLALFYSVCITAILSSSFFVTSAFGDVFSMPGTQKSLDFVTVGDPGNAAMPTTGAGAVNYVYKIGKYEVAVAQYAQFLNAVAKTDTYGLYNTVMSGAINRTGVSGNYSYTTTTLRENYPIGNVSWGDAMRFVNWLENGQPVGLQGAGTTETGAYTINGATTATQYTAISLNANAKYHIALLDEWYKAAYYKGGGTNAGYWLYPTQSNATPNFLLQPLTPNSATYRYGITNNPEGVTPVGTFVNSAGPYGTFDQAGNVFEMIDLNVDPGSKALIGGSLYTIEFQLQNNSMAAMPTAAYESGDIGFRIVTVVPEPSSAILIGCGGITMLLGYLQCKKRIRI